VKKEEELFEITISDAQFRFDSSEILEPSRLSSDIDKIVKELKKRKDINIEIIGHTDSVGKVEYNEILSTQRAASVAKVFLMKGIKEDRMIIIGKGELEPVANNDTPEGRARNRRVEIKERSQ
jgi:outer membrane protein OmpA-like peptidoglycan-associated protein